MTKRRGAGLRAATALLALLLLTLIATLVGYNAPLTTRLTATDSTRQVFFGFHGLERADDGPFRWTDGDGRVCLEQVGRVAGATVSVRILGEGANALGRERVSFFVDDRPVVTAPIQGATRIYHVHVGDALAAADSACVRIVSEAAPSAGDVRPLGVPFAGLALTPVASEQLTRPAVPQLLLNLALATLAFWLLLQAGVGPWAAVAGVGAVALAVTLAILGGLTAPGPGLARHTLPLAVGLGAVGAARVALRRQPSGAGLLAQDLGGMAFWSALLFGLTWLIQQLLGYGGVWPLKAGFYPSLTPLAAMPTLLFAGWAWLVLRRLGRGAAGWAGGAALVVVGGLLLATTLKGTVRGWDTLFATFTDNPFEYIADVPRVGDDPVGFLRGYVASQPELALHSSTHPPGSILLLWAVGRVLGPGPAAASWVAIGLSALAPLAALWVGGRLGGPRLGLLAGALAAVMPGQLVYAVTSMDGVFNALLAAGAGAFLLALEPRGRLWEAALAGLLIAAGLFFTYAATQLFFFGAAVAAVAALRGLGAAEGSTAARWRAAAGPVLRQGLVAAGVIALIYLGLWAATGYNVAEGAVRSTAINAETMRDVQSRPFLPPSLSFYVLFLVANLLAFGWYLGPWGLTAASAAGGAALRQRPLDGGAALAAGVAALVAGMALGGLFNREVERIWGFAYPLVAVLVARHALQGDGREQRWRAGLYLALAFAHGLAARMLLNTFW